jgi:hypothetical protein
MAKIIFALPESGRLTAASWGARSPPAADRTSIMDGSILVPGGTLKGC